MESPPPSLGEVLESALRPDLRAGKEALWRPQDDLAAYCTAQAQEDDECSTSSSPSAPA